MSEFDKWMSPRYGQDAEVACGVLESEKDEVDRGFEAACCLEFGLCNTGMPEHAMHQLFMYLGDLIGPMPSVSLFNYEGQTQVLMAMACDIAVRAGFVDYGVSARCAWITDRGRAWMDDYRKYGAP